ncbi:YlbF family regulator [Defluviitalea phaphyphila]|uniref:YlbF family regulator n=1 Tax=Defluviitalea phaphyphila TaxID=1473580 RepID=UPI000730EEA1|nr:YlbF family regulator [Defluviitalea phaphyphila]
MKYGENSLLVEEVIKEVGNMKLFKKSDKLLTDVMIINDFEKAQYLAFEYDDYEMNNEKGYTWTSIKELEMSEVYGIVYQNPDYKNFMKALRSINKLIEKIYIF